MTTPADWCLETRCSTCERKLAVRLANLCARLFGIHHRAEYHYYVECPHCRTDSIVNTDLIPADIRLTVDAQTALSKPLSSDRLALL